MALVVQYLPPETSQADSIQPQSGTRRCLESHARKSVSKIQSHNNDNRMYLKSPSGISACSFKKLPAVCSGMCTVNSISNPPIDGHYSSSLFEPTIRLDSAENGNPKQLRRVSVANPIIQPCVVKHSDCRSPPPAKTYEKNPWFLCPSLVPCYGPCLLGALLTMAFITLLRIPGRLGEERRWSTTKNTAFTLT